MAVSWYICYIHLKKYSNNNPLEPNFKKSPTDLFITSSLTPFLFLDINVSLLREKEVMISAIQDPNFNRDLPHLFIRSFVNAEFFPFFIPRRCFMEVSLPRTIHRNDISTSRYNAERTLCHPFETRLAGETAGGTWRKKRGKKKKVISPHRITNDPGDPFPSTTVIYHSATFRKRFRARRSLDYFKHAWSTRTKCVNSRCALSRNKALIYRRVYSRGTRRE